MSSGLMLSRVADSIYWMFRYLERVENTVRLMDVNWHLMLDMPQVKTNEWETLLHVSGDFALFEEHYSEITPENVMRFMTFDRLNPNSMISCLTAARENARGARDVVTPDLWELINGIYLMVREYDCEDRGFYKNPYDLYHEVQSAVLHTFGQAHATMFRGQSWQFLRIGTLLERADKTTRILDVRYFLLLPSLREVGTALEDLQWAALLRSVSNIEPFIKHYGPVHAKGIIEYLLLDSRNPRSVRGCLQQADEALRGIHGTSPGYFSNDAERLSGQLCADLSYLTVDEVVRRGLHEYLDELQYRMNQVHQAIEAHYFSPDSGEWS